MKLLYKLKYLLKLSFWKSLYRKILYRNSYFPSLKAQNSYRFGKTYRATHISAFNYGNMGDMLLPICLRKLFNDYLKKIKWHNGHVYNNVDALDARLMNNDDFIVIGGGGLFVKTDFPSGWLWYCNLNSLRKLKKPLIVFAVGYNRFRGQEDFDPIFSDHINTLVKQAAFIGLRNHGSIDKVKAYLKTKELKDKLCFQPCMTTVISRLYPDYIDYDEKCNFIAINCAFDKEEKRTSDLSKYEVIAKVAHSLSRFSDIKVYIHCDSDKKIFNYFYKYPFNYEVVEFSNAEDMITAYSTPRLVIGMRGHAQMIPFGCHTPILSIISHDKMQYFLDDIHHPEWGVEFNDDNFEDKLYERAVYIYDNYKDVIQEIKKEQEILWTITMQNMEAIKGILNKSCKQ